MRVVITGTLSEDVHDHEDLVASLRARLTEVYTDETEHPLAIDVESVELV